MLRIGFLSIFILIISSPCLALANNFTIINYPEISATSNVSIDITNNSDFSNQGWGGDGSASNPYILESQQISTNSSCLSISNTTLYFIVRNCEFESYWYEDSGIGYPAVRLANVTNGVIIDCDIESSASDIYLLHCSNVNITRNSLTSQHTQGFNAYDIRNCIVSENTLLESGIEISTGSFLTLSDNQITDSKSSGVHLYNISSSYLIANSIHSSATDGIVLDETYYTEVSQNEITDNDGNGIRALAFNTRFINNSLTNNLEYGIDLEGSGNVLYGNLFLNNVVANARDRGTDNRWDDAIGLGNYWDDYFGWGSYNIDGSSGNEDRYPQSYPGILSPLQLTILLVGVVIIFVCLFLTRRKR